MRLRDAKPELREQIRAAPSLWIGLDFDGTLSHHVGDPMAGEITPLARAALQELARLRGVALAFISGRAMADLQPRIGLPNVAYAGNHGLEILLAGELLLDPSAVRLRPQLDAIANTLARTVANWPGVCFQDKRLSLSVDHRDSPPEWKVAIPPAVDAALQTYPGLFAHHGQHGSEIRPVGGRHKGFAVRYLWEKQLGCDALPIFLGDDRTDEDGFAAVPHGITVCVGDRPTSARYRAKCPDEVAEFLAWLAEVQRQRV